MSWTDKYQMRHEFMAYFLTEQEYVDAMFVQIVLFNFGVWVEVEDLVHTEHVESGALKGKWLWP